MTAIRELPNKGTSGNDLILYQLGEVKTAISNLDTKLGNFEGASNARITQLEIWRASVEEKFKSDPKPIDVQKILLGAFALIASALAIIQSGVLNR